MQIASAAEPRVPVRRGRRRLLPRRVADSPVRARDAGDIRQTVAVVEQNGRLLIIDRATNAQVKVGDNPLRTMVIDDPGPIVALSAFGAKTYESVNAPDMVYDYHF